MAFTTSMTTSSFRVMAFSYDTQQRLPYNPHRTYPKKNLSALNPPKTPQVNNFTSSSKTPPIKDVSALLVRKSHAQETEVDIEDSYLGYDRWLPSAPKVKKPRSMCNAASLAYIGDCIYELYARRHFLFPPLSIEEYNDRVMAVVRCEAQDSFLQKLIAENCLSEEERSVLKWGKNIGSAKTRTIKRAGVAVYNRASSLETLIGYLYLTNVQRLEDLMEKLGFSTGASAQLIQAELSKQLEVSAQR